MSITKMNIAQKVTNLVSDIVEDVISFTQENLQVEKDEMIRFINLLRERYTGSTDTEEKLPNPEDRCTYFYKRGKKEGKQCTGHKEEKMLLCKKHLPKGCQHVLLKGDNKGKKCKERISKHSETKSYCFKHLTLHESTKLFYKKIKDTEFLLHEATGFVLKDGVEIIEDGKTKKVKVVIGKQVSGKIEMGLTDDDFTSLYCSRLRISPDQEPRYNDWLQLNKNILTS